MSSEAGAPARSGTEPAAATTDLSIIEAIRSALICEMARDERVVVFGMDVGRLGGVFRVTAGLQERFGADRVFDTPLAEASIAGACVGLAAGWSRSPRFSF